MPRSSILTRRKTLALIAGGTVALASPARAQSPSAADVVRRSFELQRPPRAQFNATLILRAAKAGDRERVLTGANMRLDAGAYARTIRFESPSDIRGTATLTVQQTDRDDDLWVYLPALRRVRRLVSSNRRDSYIGTEFTYGDILGLEVEDWTHAFKPDVTVDGAPCWEVESIVASQQVARDLGYSRIVSAIRKDCSAQVRIDYFALGGQPLKTLQASDIKVVDKTTDRRLPMRLDMRNAAGDRSTLLQFKEYRTDVSLPASRFTSSALEG